MTIKAVKDLEWTINSPSLISNQENWPETASSIDAEWSGAWLSELKKDPEPLLRHLKKQTSHFLGSYFESLWAFYLSESPHLELVAQNLQVRTLKKTIGEFDFIIFDKTSQRFIHQEIAIKFYLGFYRPNTTPFTDQKSLWIGPQCRDRLDLKIGKLINTQTRLSQNEFGQRTLKKMGIEDIETQILMKGYLFYPDGKTVSAPDYCNPDHLKGSWVPVDKLRSFLLHTKASTPSLCAWQILPKQDWVSPLTVENRNKHLEFSDKQDSSGLITQLDDTVELATQRVTNENRPWMIACLIQKNGYFIETNRVFAVPNQWPNIES